jgi:pimeloyl-ACP methyl ester carboxylesterase
MSQNKAEPTDKYQLYRSEIEERLKSGNEHEKNYAAYQQSLLEDSQFMVINGTVHHVHDSGPKDAKDVVVLIHGWDCWWMWWHKVITALNNKGIRTIAYDLKGHGWSNAAANNTYTLLSFSEDLDALIKSLEIKDYHIAAFSLGPFIALEYATQFKHNIKSMIFFNFGYFPNNIVLSTVIPKFIPFVFDNILRYIKWWQPMYLYAKLTLIRNPAPKEDIIIGMDSLRFISSEAIQETAQQITQIEVTENLPNLVSTLDTPILFVAGKGDQVVPWKNTERLYEHAKNARLVTIKKCGHLITLELPELTADLIERQINSLLPESSLNGQAFHEEVMHI